MIEKVQTQTKANAEEIIQKIMDHTQDRCRCKFSPEGLVSFVIKQLSNLMMKSFQNKIYIIKF